MTDFNSNSQNLFSLADVEDTFGGRSELRRLINKLLPLTSSTYVEAKRPVFQPSLSYRLTNELAEKINNLERTDDMFEVSFNYIIRENNDEFVKLLLELWFEYEQPFFCFFQSPSNIKRKIETRMTWRDFIESEPCLTMFKGAEENVVWLGKSEIIEIDWENIFEDG